ncbi:MAG: flagellar basal body rod protein FlgC [Thiohalobacterales bacterium]|nr:flagellar basal body rod protein FlgC [Thiohalobacterales bacterium]
MGLFNIFDVAGSGMSAQTVRLNTVASNMANAEVISGTEEGAYRARQPVFAAVMQAMGNNHANVPVEVKGVIESEAPVNKQYSPAHPAADADGYIYTSNVNMVEEMANMISASRSYQSNVEVANTSQQLLMETLRLGK